AREPVLPRAPGARAALRARRGAPPHARRGGAHVQRYARADPPDREPVAEEAAVARRGPEASRRRVTRAIALDTSLDRRRRAPVRAERGSRARPGRRVPRRSGLEGDRPG